MPTSPRTVREAKLFVVRKYVMAKSAEDAIKREKGVSVSDVWLDDEWKKAQIGKKDTQIGFNR